MTFRERHPCGHHIPSHTGPRAGSGDQGTVPIFTVYQSGKLCRENGTVPFAPQRPSPTRWRPSRTDRSPPSGRKKAAVRMWMSELSKSSHYECLLGICFGLSHRLCRGEVAKLPSGDSPAPEDFNHAPRCQTGPRWLVFLKLFESNQRGNNI